jgi:hypothetical protein
MKRVPVYSVFMTLLYYLVHLQIIFVDTGMRLMRNITVSRFFVERAVTIIQPNLAMMEYSAAIGRVGGEW